MKKALIVIGILVVVFVITVAGVVIGKYNAFVSLNENITGQWSEVENQLQRRSDLIPNLVSSVKGYAKHEKAVFQAIADARAQMAGAKTISEKIAANQMVDSALARLLVVVENYPNLKADASFMRLMDELAGTENRIAVARNRYNDAVLTYNIMVKRFPGNIIASIFNFEKKDVYFKAEEKAKEVPKVEF